MKTFRFALKTTVPVLCGYLFLGMAFGLLLQRAGYAPIWAFSISLLVYAGSMQFAMIGLLAGGASLLSTALLTLSINSRHIFYGLSFLEKFQGMGALKPYMIFSLTDETYSLLCSVKTPEGLSEKKVAFWIAALDHAYWVIGSTLGALFGAFLNFDLQGIDFAMTALFAVIFIEQWLSAKSHFPALVGLLSGLLCLLIFGANRFILPALVLSILALLFAGRKEAGA